MANKRGHHFLEARIVAVRDAFERAIGDGLLIKIPHRNSSRQDSRSVLLRTITIDRALAKV
jgi:hypothetical protein